MNKNIVIAILIIILLVGIYFAYYKDGDYKYKIETIERERDSIIMQFAILEYKNDSIVKLKTKILWRTKKTTEELNKQENETNAIPGIVATYTDRKLDSILTNHRFKARKKSSDSINP